MCETMEQLEHLLIAMENKWYARMENTWLVFLFLGTMVDEKPADTLTHTHEDAERKTTVRHNLNEPIAHKVKSYYHRYIRTTTTTTKPENHSEKFDAEMQLTLERYISRAPKRTETKRDRRRTRE